MDARGEAVLDIATFLARGWSGRAVTVGFSPRNRPESRPAEMTILMPHPDRYGGDGLGRYRQFRAGLWQESMRLKHCQKVLSGDHAFGFILNAMETRRVEALGRREWPGMDTEIAFSHAYALNYRPQLASVYGRARIVEAFYQAFMFGGIKGEMQQSHLERVQGAAARAAQILGEAVEGSHGTEWMERRAYEIIKILDIDSLLTIPAALPWTRRGMALSEEELRRTISKLRGGTFAKVDQKAVSDGRNVRGEYTALLDEGRRGSAREVGIEVPPTDNVDESAIYDADLTARLKAKFKEWRTGWHEQSRDTGDEFDAEGYAEGTKPFLVDVKTAVKSKITILLDHSSSIHPVQAEYKKATLSLCEVLSYIDADFSVYAFSTSNRAVVCWMIKPDGARWNHICAKRLAQVSANGSTPLAEVYQKMRGQARASSPDIFLTLTDGEPSDPAAVRTVLKSYKKTGVRMVAMGMGPDTVRATAIAGNLRTLGYERTLAVSRLRDIPDKVLGILRYG